MYMKYIAAWGDNDSLPSTNGDGSPDTGQPPPFGGGNWWGDGEVRNYDSDGERPGRSRGGSVKEGGDEDAAGPL